jgi:hypothetical protein
MQKLPLLRVLRQPAHWLSYQYDRHRSDGRWYTIILSTTISVTFA